MNKFNNKGISLTTLTVAIVLLIIITSILVYNAQTGTKLKKLNEMYNDVELLTDKISIYYSKYAAIPVAIPYENQSKINQIKENLQLSPNDNDKYYIIDLSALENVTLNYGRDYKEVTKDNANTKEDVYIINEQSHHIYYVKGIILDGISYYTNDRDEKIDLMFENI